MGVHDSSRTARAAITISEMAVRQSKMSTAYIHSKCALARAATVPAQHLERVGKAAGASAHMGVDAQAKQGAARRCNT